MSAVLEKSRQAEREKPEAVAKKLYGVMQAPVTPLHQDFSVDYDGFARMVDFHVHNGAPAIAWTEAPGLMVKAAVLGMLNKR